MNKKPESKKQTSQQQQKNLKKQVENPQKQEEREEVLQKKEEDKPQLKKSNYFAYKFSIVYVKSNFDLENQVIPFIKATIKSVFQEEKVIVPDIFEPQPFDASKKLFGSLLCFFIYSEKKIEEKKIEEFKISLLISKAYETEKGEDANNCPLKNFQNLEIFQLSEMKNSFIEQTNAFLKSCNFEYQLQIDFYKNKLESNIKYDIFFEEEIKNNKSFQDFFEFQGFQISQIDFGSSITFNLKDKKNYKSQDELLIFCQQLKSFLKNKLGKCLKVDFKNKQYEPIRFLEIQK